MDLTELKMFTSTRNKVSSSIIRPEQIQAGVRNRLWAKFGSRALCLERRKILKFYWINVFRWGSKPFFLLLYFWCQKSFVSLRASDPDWFFWIYDIKSKKTNKEGILRMRYSAPDPVFFGQKPDPKPWSLVFPTEIKL